MTAASPCPPTRAARVPRDRLNVLLGTAVALVVPAAIGVGVWWASDARFRGEVRGLARELIGSRGQDRREAARAMREAIEAEVLPPDLVDEDRVRILVQHGLPAVRAALGAEDDEVAGDAVASLRAFLSTDAGRSQAHAAVPVLARRARDSRPEVRRESIALLAAVGRGEPEAIAALEQALEDRDDTVRREAADALTFMGDAACSALERGLRSHDPVVRATCAENIDAWGESSGTVDVSILEALAGLLARDPDAGVRAAAAEGIGQWAFWLEVRTEGQEWIPLVLGPVIAGLDDPHAEVRLACGFIVQTLGPLGSDAVPVLRRLLASDADERVRARAAFALASMGTADEPILTALRGARTADADDEVRCAAGIALDRLEEVEGDEATPDR